MERLIKGADKKIFLRKLQKLPGRIKKYFKHPKIAYAV